jgi:hypothetical protein
MRKWQREAFNELTYDVWKRTYARMDGDDLDGMVLSWMREAPATASDRAMLDAYIERHSTVRITRSWVKAKRAKGAA